MHKNTVNGCDTVLIGYLNCRLGTLESFINPDQCINYTENSDRTLNLNGKDIISIMSICMTNNLLPINHLVTESTQCNGGLTYRKKDSWVSQAFCSRATTNLIGAFTLLQDIVVNCGGIEKIRFPVIWDIPGHLQSTGNTWLSETRLSEILIIRQVVMSPELLTWLP